MTSLSLSPGHVPTVRFSLSLNGRVPVEQPPPQSSCRPAGGGVKCVWSFVTDSLITFLVFWNKKMNSLWAKEQNVISCYQLDDLGLPWRQFENSWGWKSPLRPSRNFWKVARMKYIIILSGYNKFRKFDRKIWLSNWFEIVDMTNVRQNLTAFLADISLLKGSMGTDIRETLTLLMCEDCSPFCALLDNF